jgi:hypothetical protein
MVGGTGWGSGDGMSWSTPDLSDVTQVLKGLVENAINQSTLPVGNIKVYCDSPDAARNNDGFCHLTLYLLHVGQDPNWRAPPVSGPRAQRITAQPLSLNLSYLLTAWCEKDFVSEQRAMTIALRMIHSTPIVTQATIQANMLQQWLPQGQFVMSITADTIEEMSRLWQAFTVPIRLSSLIRVGIVFIDPETAAPPPALPPSTANLTVSPLPVTSGAAELLPGGALDAPPIAPDAKPAQIEIGSGPLVCVGGGTVSIAGSGLDLPAASDVFLAAAGGGEWNVTSPWRQAPAQPGLLMLAFPAGYADPGSALPGPPTAMPNPGLYSLSVGKGAVRSNAIPIVIAPRIDGVPNPPILPPDGSGLYTIQGGGFVPAATQVSFGANPLAATAGPPGPGEFSVHAGGKEITFKPPSGATAGSYPIVLGVNGISPSTGWVVVLT